MGLNRRQFIAGSVAAGATTLLAGGPFVARARASEYERLVHPYATSQPTATGRKVNTLHAHGGRIFTGYGDANNYGGGNTGPIHIVSFDPASGTWQDHLTFGTEKVSRYRAVGGTLVTTANDPRVDNEFLAMQQADGQWVSLNGPVRQNHVYDICEGHLAGQQWACGSASGPNYQRAQVWRSTDGGATWQQAFDPGPVVIAAVDQAHAGRFYHIAHLEGTTVTQLFHDPFSWMHRGDDDEARWLPGPNLNCFQYPVLFDRKLVYGDLDPDANDTLLTKDVPTTGVLRTLDSLGQIETIATDVRCGRASELYVEENGHCVGDDGRLYVVGDDRVLYATGRLGQPFVAVGRAPSEPPLYSLAVLAGSAYFGSAEGEIYRLPL